MKDVKDAISYLQRKGIKSSSVNQASSMEVIQYWIAIRKQMGD